MATQRLWLRCEKKEFERRTAITPTTAKRLIDAGFEIYVERDTQRIFRDEEYEAYVFPCVDALNLAHYVTYVQSRLQAC